MKKIAFVLAGCGGLDGAEIGEAMTLLLAAKQLGYGIKCFALDTEQACVVNHRTFEKTEEKRNVLVEAARIARGARAEIESLDKLNCQDFDILYFVGGFGSAQNNFNYAEKGLEYDVNPLVASLVREFREQNKTICAICISPLILARTLKNIKITMGNDAKLAEFINNNGNQHVNTESGNICVDEENKIITSPCYMLTDDLSVIYTEVKKILEQASEW